MSRKHDAATIRYLLDSLLDTIINDGIGLYPRKIKVARLKTAVFYFFDDDPSLKAIVARLEELFQQHVELQRSICDCVATFRESYQRYEANVAG